jgi:hypothetical protein
LLNAILDKTIFDEDWDNFISIKIVNPELEKVRQRVEEIWTYNSPYRVSHSIDPTDLNPRGVTEIQRLIDSIQVREV